MALWCSGYHYCATSFNETWTQVLRRFKSCLWHVGDSQWWGSLTVVLAGNKAKHLSLVNHTTSTIHLHLHRHLQEFFLKIIIREWNFWQMFSFYPKYNDFSISKEHNRLFCCQQLTTCEIRMSLWLFWSEGSQVLSKDFERQTRILNMFAIGSMTTNEAYTLVRTKQKPDLTSIKN